MTSPSSTWASGGAGDGVLLPEVVRLLLVQAGFDGVGVRDRAAIGTGDLTLQLEAVEVAADRRLGDAEALAQIGHAAVAGQHLGEDPLAPLPWPRDARSCVFRASSSRSPIECRAIRAERYRELRGVVNVQLHETRRVPSDNLGVVASRNPQTTTPRSCGPMSSSPTALQRVVIEREPDTRLVGRCGRAVAHVERLQQPVDRRDRRRSVRPSRRRGRSAVPRRGGRGAPGTRAD